MSGTIFVSGASGFVGRAMLERMVADGRRVRAATRGPVAQLPRGADTVPGFELADVRSLRAAVTQVECVVHLAARVHVRGTDDAREQQRHNAINLDGTLALADEAARAGVRRFIFMSTVAVNGNSTEVGRPFTEASPRAPKQPYGRSKNAAEERLQIIAASTGMEVVIVRPPLVYGPGAKGTFQTMVQWLTRGLPLPFGAIVDNRRTLLGLDNLVDLVSLCVDHPAAADQIFLAGDSEDVSTTDLLQRLAAALGVPARLVPVPPWLLQAPLAAVGRGDLASRLLGSLQVDSTKARLRLGWAPAVSLDEGLRRAAAQYRQSRHADRARVNDRSVPGIRRSDGEEL